MAPPPRRAVTKPWMSCIGAPFLPFLEFLLQPAVEGAPGAELRGEDPEPGAAPDLILLVPQIDDIEPSGHLPERGEGELLLDPEVGLLIGAHRRVVRMHDGAPQTAAGQEVQAE